MTSYYFKNVFGINDFVYSSTESDFGKNVAKGKKAYFSSKNYRLSVLNGFSPDSDSLTDYNDEYEKYADIWQEDDLDSQYEKIQKMFAKKQKEDVEKANQQVKEWKDRVK
jgi:hypothetical protein